MIDSGALSELTVSAFCNHAVKSVILIDEQFPNLGEALAVFEEQDNSEFVKRFRESDIAQELYTVFRGKDLLCDVANKPEDWEESLSSTISESDLVVLDLHLKEDSDSTDSIKLLKSLAEAKKFNLVVVYTRDKELTTVGRRLAGSLRGKLDVELDPDFEIELRGVIDELDSLECPIDEIVDSFLRGSEPDSAEFRKFHGQLLANHAELRKHREFIAPLIAQKLLSSDQFGAIADPGLRTMTAANFDCENPWMVFENVFVVLANKEDTPPKSVMEVLESAILAWNPGVVRTLIAEIQNTMSRRGYAFAENLATDIETQVGWLWHATHSRQTVGDASSTVTLLLNRMLLALRNNLLRDDDLGTFTSNCLDVIPEYEDSKKQIKAAQFSCASTTSDEMRPSDVLHALNAYQSSDVFSGDFVTTGTILYSHDESGKRWWACVEPACNTVPSQAAENAKFIQCRLIELSHQTSEAESIVQKASQSRHLFVVLDGEREFLSVVNSVGNPVPRTAYVAKESQINAVDDGHEVEVFFPSLNRAEPQLARCKMRIVAQLHEQYAIRLLHLAGHHMSRVGLDFIDFPNVQDTKNEQPENVNEA